ncbi:peptidase family M13 [Lasiosphaeria hispida]|uniref:Peptidase family M13 n=1 Tax=Lasiosphaeria hispida TaxID=260671 RepID=A0AAJ0HEZ5_9PEZI|nr:peptidase family M13 [Lasiosphaeria hispida]
MKHLARALCLTPACVQLGAEYVKNLSPEYTDIDACANFEELVCGGWRDRHEIQPNREGLTVFDLLSQKATETLRAVVTGPYPNQSNHSRSSPQKLAARQASLDQQNFEMMKLAYSACTDEKAIAEAGVQPISALLDELAATFGMDDWSEPYVFLKRTGYNALLNMVLFREVDDADLPVLIVTQTVGLGLLSPENYDKPELVGRYTAALSELLGKLYPGKTPPEDAKRLADDVVRFEKQLATIGVPNRSVTDPRVNGKRISVADASKLVPELGLDKIVRNLSPAGYNLDRLPIAINDPAFFSNLSAILLKTPKEAVRAYLIARTIAAAAELVKAPDIFDPWNKLMMDAGLSTAQAPSSREETCMRVVSQDFGWILSRFFVEGVFSGRDKEVSDQIVADVRQVYIDKFRSLPWMDDATKAKATEKVEAMFQKIGYPTSSPNLTDPLSVRDFYSDVHITPSYFHNALSMRNKSLVTEWSALGKPRDRDAWPFYATVVDAAYDPRQNEIVFPAGILQPPFFDSGLPSAVNYGAFGAVAGHEVSHAFDVNGRLYDADGKVADWWGDETEKEYNRRVGCFVRQFDNFTVQVPGSHMAPLQVNGTLTLPENIADSAGLVVSHKAWLRHRETSPDEPRGLPGLEGVFTEEQLFFVAYTNMWCAKATEKGLRNMVKATHAPGQARAMGTLQNSRAFREAFGCMVKEPTCELW